MVHPVFTKTALFYLGLLYTNLNEHTSTCYNNGCYVSIGLSPEEFANAEDWERQTWDKEKPKSKKVHV